MPAPAAPTVTRGARAFGASPTTGPAANLYPRFYGDKIHKWWADRYPTSSIVQKIRSKEVYGPTWSHFEQQETPRYATQTAASTAGTSAITFTNHYGRFNTNDIWMNMRTFERVRVSDAFAAIDATVGTSRGWGGVPSQDSLAGDRWKKVGSAGAEAEGAREAISTSEDEFTFRIQDFRDSTELTTRAMATRFEIEPNYLLRLREEKKYQHKMDIADSFFWGGLHRDQGTSGERTGTMGLMEHIKTNTWNVNGRITFGSLSKWIANCIAPWNQNQELMLITSCAVKNIINNWGLERIAVNAESPVSKWGIDIDTLLLVGGRKVAIIEESSFNESRELSGMVFVGSPNLAAWRGFDQDLPWAGEAVMARSTRLSRNIERENNVLLYKEEFFTSGGWEFWAERAWGWAWNIWG